MSNPTPEDLSALIEAYRTLVHRLPAGARVSAYREAGAKSGVVNVTMGNGESFSFVGELHKNGSEGAAP